MRCRRYTVYDTTDPCVTIRLCLYKLKERSNLDYQISFFCLQLVYLRFSVVNIPEFSFLWTFHHLLSLFFLMEVVYYFFLRNILSRVVSSRKLLSILSLNVSSSLSTESPMYVILCFLSKSVLYSEIFTNFLNFHLGKQILQIFWFLTVHTTLV